MILVLHAADTSKIVVPPEASDARAGLARSNTLVRSL
jgi:hypothetical protein